MATREILSISTLTPDRLSINIDGRSYELADPDDLGIEEIVKLDKLYREISEIEAMEREATEEDARNLAVLLDKLARVLLLECPEEVHSRLNDNKRLLIFKAFEEAVGGEKRAKPQPQNRAQRRQIGGRKSRSAKSSTVETRKVGST